MDLVSDVCMCDDKYLINIRKFYTTLSVQIPLNANAILKLAILTSRFISNLKDSFIFS